MSARLALKASRPGTSRCALDTHDARGTTKTGIALDSLDTRFSVDSGCSRYAGDALEAHEALSAGRALNARDALNTRYASETSISLNSRLTRDTRRSLSTRSTLDSDTRKTGITLHTGITLRAGPTLSTGDTLTGAGGATAFNRKYPERHLRLPSFSNIHMTDCHVLRTRERSQPGKGTEERCRRRGRGANRSASGPR